MAPKRARRSNTSSAAAASQGREQPAQSGSGRRAQVAGVVEGAIRNGRRATLDSIVAVVADEQRGRSRTPVTRWPVERSGRVTSASVRSPAHGGILPAENIRHENRDGQSGPGYPSGVEAPRFRRLTMPVASPVQPAHPSNRVLARNDTWEIPPYRFHGHATSTPTARIHAECAVWPSILHNVLVTEQLKGLPAIKRIQTLYPVMVGKVLFDRFAVVIPRDLGYSGPKLNSGQAHKIVCGQYREFQGKSRKLSPEKRRQQPSVAVDTLLVNFLEGVASTSPGAAPAHNTVAVHEHDWATLIDIVIDPNIPDVD